MNIKTIIAALATLALTSTANAIGVKPPAKYLGPGLYDGVVSVTEFPLSQLQTECKNKMFPIGVIYGCAYVLKDRCIVFIIDKPYPNIQFPFGRPIMYPVDVLEHEMAHCNGWHNNHKR